MTRDEHLSWAKQRALKHLDEGRATAALAQIITDLAKFPGLLRHPDVPKIRKAMVRRDPAELRVIIEGMT